MLYVTDLFDTVDCLGWKNFQRYGVCTSVSFCHQMEDRSSLCNMVGFLDGMLDIVREVSPE